MGMHVYEVAGGWQAEDDRFFMACFGRDAEEARRALRAAIERAHRIAERWATMPEVDEPLTPEDVEAIRRSREEIVRGEVRTVRPRSNHSPVTHA